MEKRTDVERSLLWIALRVEYLELCVRVGGDERGCWDP